MTRGGDTPRINLSTDYTDYTPQQSRNQIFKSLRPAWERIYEAGSDVKEKKQAPLEAPLLESGHRPEIGF